MDAFVVDLGCKEYEEAWSLQHRVHTARCGHRLPDTLLVVEHPHVLTTGRRGRKDSILVPEADLRERGIPCLTIERGGDVTYHGPGQLVGYPIFRVEEERGGILGFVSRLEEVMIRALRDYGIFGERNERNRGVWVGNEKIGFVGIAVRKRVSFHGFALNVRPDLSFFEMIHPCGLRNVKVASMASLLGRRVEIEEVKARVLAHFEKVFEVSVKMVEEKAFSSGIEADASSSSGVRFG